MEFKNKNKKKPARRFHIELSLSALNFKIDDEIFGHLPRSNFQKNKYTLSQDFPPHPNLI